MSKNLIYDFHYDYIKSEYGNNSRLLIIDTDHLMCEVRTEVVYEDFSKDKECLILVIIQLKVHSKSEILFGYWNPFKNYEKCFLFHLKSSFHSQDI